METSTEQPTREILSGWETHYCEGRENTHTKLHVNKSHTQPEDQSWSITQTAKRELLNCLKVIGPCTRQLGIECQASGLSFSLLVSVRDTVVITAVNEAVARQFRVVIHRRGSAKLLHTSSEAVCRLRELHSCTMKVLRLCS